MKCIVPRIEIWNRFFGDQTETGVRANIWRYIDTQQALKVMKKVFSP
jgi:hypothetical protein